MRWIAALAVSIAIGPVSLPAYYHFTHFLPNGGTAPEKFDLSALPNNTITFFTSESGPTLYSQTDTFNSVLSQIQQASLVWNGIGSSSLRVSFGGLENTATPQNTPAGDVIFEDLPPGVEGYGGPTSLASPVTAADGSQFFPIVRSVIHLSLNLQLAPGPSYNQSFLMTTIHEMGHALGLQHTFTSATMSQATTSATTLSHPVAADDIAGLSVLYPNANFGQFGSITGKITAGGAGVNLASVVAIQPGADAISAVTNADGSFRMDGVPPGSYAIYVHTMPPDADIFGPDGNVVTGFTAVNSLFYPATTNFAQARLVSVTAGNVTGGINVQTTKRASIPLYDGQVYGYLNNDTIEITPAPVQIPTASTPVIAASLVGLGFNEPADQLSVQFPGGGVSIVPNGVTPYFDVANGYTYAYLYLALNPGVQAGTQHMIFNTSDYMYVLPSAMYLTATAPPTVSTATSNGDGTVTVTGTNWVAGTLIYFDSLPATILSANPTGGSAVVIPPPGANGQTATLTAYNPDGQNSQFLQSGAPVTYFYGSMATPVITSITPSSLPAGAQALVDITGSGFSFVQGQTTIGFGSSDIAVEKIFVLSPTHVQVDVSVGAKAALSNPDVSAISGFQVATAPAGFQITAAQPDLPAPFPTLFNGLPGLTGSYAGATVTLYGANLSAPKMRSTISIGGQQASILYASDSQINLVIPAGLEAGPALLTINNGIQNSYPIVVDVDSQPAAIAAVQNAMGAYVDATMPAHPGDLLIVTLSNFAPVGANVTPASIQVNVGGINHTATEVAELMIASVNYSQVFFRLNANDPIGGAEPLIVYFNGRSSFPASIPVIGVGSN